MRIRNLIAGIAIGSSVVFTSAAFAQSEKPKQSVGEYTSDAAITTKVKAAIVADKRLSALEIAVETNNGVAKLTGTVGTAAEADHAAAVARQVSGVKQVKNELKVATGKAR